jgi:AcrR family transcriptional regulator
LYTDQYTLSGWTNLVKPIIVLIGMKRTEAPQTRGRPREFDADKALEQAMRVFWKHGYEGSSLPELTRAMGINRPSLYAAFGNKEELFRLALDRYVAQAGGLFREALSQPTARGVVEHLLRSVVCRGSAGKMRGCLLVQGALACGEEADPIRQELSKRRYANELILRRRFEQALAEGDLPKGSDPAALAKFVATFQQGLAVQLAGGAGREELSAAVDLALQAWPTKK